MRNRTTRTVTALLLSALATVGVTTTHAAATRPAVIHPATVGLCSAHAVGAHTEGTCWQLTQPGVEGFWTFQDCGFPGIGTVRQYGTTYRVAGPTSSTPNCTGTKGSYGISHS